jgi:hypothetical protein
VPLSPHVDLPNGTRVLFCTNCLAVTYITALGDGHISRGSEPLNYLSGRATSNNRPWADFDFLGSADPCSRALQCGTSFNAAVMSAAASSANRLSCGKGLLDTANRCSVATSYFR